MSKTLQILTTAYKATLEEQDDPALWLTAALRGKGGEYDVLLRGNAVNYAVRGQDASGLRFGDRAQTQPPRLERDLAALQGKGVKLYVLEEDLDRRGIRRDELSAGLELVAAANLPALLRTYAGVWQW